MKRDPWFDEMLLQSKVKREIVATYFATWLIIISKSKNKIAYIDLYSGPAKYIVDDEFTTGFRITKALLDIQKSSQRDFKAKIWFNDSNDSHIEDMEAQIEELSCEDCELVTKYTNSTLCNDKTDEIIGDLKSEFSDYSIFSFLDPFGLKGLSTRLIKSLLNGFGSDLLFFFNIRSLVRFEYDVALKELLGLDSLDEIVNLPSEIKKEEFLLDKLEKNVYDTTLAKYIIKFKFNLKNSPNQTSHYLIFLSKHKKGYKVMKDSIHKVSKDVRFDINLTNLQYCEPEVEQTSFFGMNKDINRIPGLEEELQKYYKNVIINKEDLYWDFEIKTKFKTSYVDSEIRKAVLSLWKKNQVKFYSTEGNLILVKANAKRFPNNVLQIYFKGDTHE